jgi:purine-binding chemotaxis protein CheW
LLEIDNMPNWTGIPGLPVTVRGLINLRGEIVSLIELRAVLGLPYPATPKKGKIFVAAGADRQTVSAFAVDDIDGIVGFNPNEMTPVPAAAANTVSAKCITATVEENGALVRILDVPGILAELEQTFSLDQAWM